MVVRLVVTRRVVGRSTEVIADQRRRIVPGGSRGCRRNPRVENLIDVGGWHRLIPVGFKRHAVILPSQPVSQSQIRTNSPAILSIKLVLVVMKVPLRRGVRR